MYMYLSFYRDIKFKTVSNFVLKLCQVWPLEADESVCQSDFNTIITSSIFMIHLIARSQSNVYSTYSTEDKLKILAAEVLGHLLVTSDLK